MTRTMIGVDSSGAGCIKIMKNDGDDPRTTPDTDYAKFQYNSKTQKMRLNARQNRAFGGGNAFEPAGAGVTNFSFYNRNFGLQIANLFWRLSSFPGIEYAMPLYDVKYKSNDDSRYVKNRVVRTYIGYQDRSAIWTTGDYDQEGWVQNLTTSGFSQNFSMDFGLALHLFGTSQDPLLNRAEVVVWNLPGNNQAISDPPLAPVAGQMQVAISSGACKISKPGYDLRTASPSQLAFDSSSNPAKVIAAGDVAIGTGTTTIPLPLAGTVVTGQFVADVIVYQGATVYYPTNPLSTETEYGADYYFSNGNLVIENPYGASRCRYIVYAYDQGGASAGSNKVLRQFNDGSRNVIQFLRPGAGDPPTLTDILIDSRWPCVSIIKEGYIDVSGSNGAAEWAIPLDMNGLFPFVKYVTVHAGGGGIVDLGAMAGSVTSRIRQPFTLFGYWDATSGGKQYYTGGGSTYCRLLSNEARFYTFRGLPTRRYLSGGSASSNLVQDFDPTPIVGIRYYILGIPA